MKIKIVVLAFLLVSVSCMRNTTETTDEVMGVKSILWTQFSAEYEALVLQAYNLASDILIKHSDSVGALPPAVTLDLDETVLDNSPFSVMMLRQGFTYSSEKWAEWCEMREALPLPGALNFIKLADSLGVEVFYVSNRTEDLMEATLDNLREYGFPNSDSAHVLLKSDSSSKDKRRAQIRETYEIILLIGDNLGDFEGVFDDRTVNYGKTTVSQMEKEFGSRFIILPNTMYGSWEKGAFPDGMPGEREVLKKLRGYKN